MGRVYLPQEDLRAHGVTEEALAAGTVTPAIIGLLRFQIDRARTLYAEADGGIPMIPDDGSRFSTQLMRTLYSRILDAIEENGYDVFSRRAHVRALAKLRLALGIMIRSSRDRMPPVARIAPGGDAVHHHDVPTLSRPEGGR